VTFHQHVERPPDERLVAGQADRLLHAHQQVAAGVFHIFVHLAGQVGGRGASLIAVGEAAHAVKTHLLDEAQQRLEFPLCLAGVADDERGANGQVGQGRAHPGDGGAHPVHIRRAAHPAQGAAVGVLQGDVQVGHDLRVGGHRINQPVGDAAGVSVHKAQPG